MNPLRIAFIGARGVPATIGGVEHHVEEIGSRLAARGHAVTVFTRSNYTAERAGRYRGMRVRYVPTPTSKRLEALTASGLSTLAAMSRGPGGADILHFHAIGPSVFSPLPRMFTRRRVVLTVHGLDYDRAKWGLGARTALRAAGLVSAHVPHATISVSRTLADYYAQHYGRRAVYIPNGVAAPALRPPRLVSQRWGLRGNDYVLFLGRLVPEKAPDLLLRAFSRVHTPIRLVIAGGSSFTDAYVRELNTLAARDPRVVMTGPVFGELRDELYTNALAFANPSSLEGLPLTVLEAAAYRLPLIVSDIPPHLEVVGRDGPGGRVVARGDEAALAAALAAVIDHAEEERRGSRSLGDRVVKEYDWDAAATATEALYFRLLEGRAGRLTGPSVAH